jgi:putative FmdB family regulatory protein
MPLYEYRCQKCGELFEVRQKFSDEPVTVHEKCGGAVEKQFSTPSFQFKGSGFYITDYAKSGSGGPGNGGSKDKGDKSGDKAASSSSSDTKSSDSKSSESKSSESKSSDSKSSDSSSAPAAAAKKD